MHNISVRKFSDHIAIVGAGIAGLALGAILKKAKIPVVIFEKSIDISEYGAGITISPNAIKILQHLDIFDNIVFASAHPKQATFYSTRKKITHFKVDVITTSRKVLYKNLYDKYISLGGEILFEHELCDFNLDKSEIYFKENKTYKVRHIAACDGIKSLFRKKIDEEKDPEYSGYSVWRSIIKKKQKNIQTYLGPNSHVVTYPISSTHISFVAAIKTNKKHKQSWKTTGNYSELKKDLKFTNKDVNALIDEKTPLFKWGVYVRPTIKKLQFNNLTLLGDAAHPIVPFIGQGACLALEDAFIFGNLLIKHNSEIKKAQNIYELSRINRIKKISYLSLRQGYLNHISNPIIIYFRNLVMKYLPEFAMRSLRLHVWNYDVDKALREFD